MGRHTYIYIYKGSRKANNRAGDVNSRGYNKATGEKIARREANNTQ